MAGSRSTVRRSPTTPRSGEQLAAAALAIARRFGDVDLEYDAMALLGEAYVAGGRVAEGMKLIDEAMTAVSAGEVVGIVAVSDILCRLLSACETAMDLARAEQWMSLAGRFEAWSDFVSPVCRNHYGGILLAVGRLADAEAELLAAVRTFERSYRLMLTSPLVKLADLRARQGRFEEAKRLLEGHEAHPIARRTLATVALARGEAALAEELVAALPRRRGRCSIPVALPRSSCSFRSGSRAATCPPQRGALDRLAAARRRLAAMPRPPRSPSWPPGGSAPPRATSAPPHICRRRYGASRALDLQLEAARAQLELASAIAESGARRGDGRGTRRAAGVRAHRCRRGRRRRGRPAARPGWRRGRAWPKRYGALTKRETEVLSLLGAGCSNAEIAERLYISRRTAEHHVAHILSKLDLRSRSEAAAYAVRELPEDP